jgi:hypothetical protein
MRTVADTGGLPIITPVAVHTVIVRESSETMWVTRRLKLPQIETACTICLDNPAGLVSTLVARQHSALL